jgi:hypothetical protein
VEIMLSVLLERSCLLDKSVEVVNALTERLSVSV